MVVYSKKFVVLVIKYHNAQISNGVKSYNLKIFGKSIVNWTVGAIKNLKPKTVLINETNTLNAVLKKYCDSYDFVAVFYYDTPLITEKNAKDSIDYAVLKDLDVCKLPKGFVFKTKFLKEQQNENGNINPKTINSQDFNHFESEFLQAYNSENLQRIKSLIKQKIVNHHKKNGVEFVDDSSVFIDYDCSIGFGCIVHPNNYIFNGSNINENCVLMPGNVIDNCVIEKGLTLTYTVITNSKISKINKPPPFTVVEDDVFVK